MSNVLPVFKGKGKPARPRIVQANLHPPGSVQGPGDVVKSDLENHLAKTEALPNNQFGFRKAARPQPR
ncbi:Hypothetical protein FKW44_010900 [Caligus rogercresseyi]|uniref:Uncharacterized protein n=1 Tax=Caligus rogercresseyi TaxID=217165 RepID=A0A7T8K9C6_CALRO|nr:Hypothetical protein FKW44_010900 [Caligus rogercresseyi]